MTALRLYKSYMFKNKDPIIDRVRTILADEGVKYTQIEEWGGATAGTLRNWFHGETRRPQFATIAATVRALGYDISLTPMNDKKIPARNVAQIAKLPKPRAANRPTGRR